MKRFHTLDPGGLPPAQVEHLLAHYVLAGADPLVRRILDALQGRPLRYSDLQPRLNRPNNNQLNRVLQWMQGEGLIDKTTDSVRRPYVYTYALTVFGILIRDRARFYEQLERAERAVAEALA